MKDNRLATRKEKVNFILDNGSDKTFTKYSVLDLAYRNSIDLDFIIEQIKEI